MGDQSKKSNWGMERCDEREGECVVSMKEEVSCYPKKESMRGREDLKGKGLTSKKMKKGHT